MPQQDKTVDQGLPNTPENAWPVKVTNGSSTILGSSSNPFPVSGNVNVSNFPTSQTVNGTVDVGNLPIHQGGPGNNVNSVITSSSYQVTLETNIQQPISIDPNTTVGVGFDTSNFSKAYVWTQLITSESNVNVDIISDINTGPPSFGSMIFVEASLSLTEFAPKVTLVNTSGNRLVVNFSNTSSETVEVRVALKGIG